MRIQCIIKKSVSNRGTRISCKKRTKTNAHFFVFLLGIFFFFHKSFYCHCFVFTSSLKQWDDCWCSLWKLLHNLHFNLKTNCLNCVSFTQYWRQSISLFAPSCLSRSFFSFDEIFPLQTLWRNIIMIECILNEKIFCCCQF